MKGYVELKKYEGLYWINRKGVIKNKEGMKIGPWIHERESTFNVINAINAIDAIDGIDDILTYKINDKIYQLVYHTFTTNKLPSFNVLSFRYI